MKSNDGLIFLRKYDKNMIKWEMQEKILFPECLILREIEEIF